MRKSFVVLAAFSLAGGPALAQSTDQSTATPQEQAQPKMVKKRVCTKSDEETGSRTSSKVCKTVMVPADASAEAEKGHKDHSGASAAD